MKIRYRRVTITELHAAVICGECGALLPWDNQFRHSQYHEQAEQTGNTEQPMLPPF